MKTFLSCLLFFTTNALPCSYSTLLKNFNKAPLFNATSLGCDYNTASIIHSFETLYFTQINILQDKSGRKFVIKQDPRTIFSPHICTIRDKIGSFIAASAHIPANKVLIIPAGFAFPGKPLIEVPATIHSFAPGVSVAELRKNRETRSIFQGSIRQFMKKTMPPEECGLTQLVLDSMASHDDLCKIVALDTFISNVDRHTKNFFYDIKTNHFCAIDLEGSFYGDLAIFGCNFISKITNDRNYRLSRKNLHALTVYRNTLHTLLSLHTPESLHNKFFEYAYEAGLLAKSVVGSPSITNKLQGYLERITSNYHSCEKLVGLLDVLIAKHAKKQFLALHISRL